jgi:hypothetical protein
VCSGGRWRAWARKIKNTRRPTRAPMRTPHLEPPHFVPPMAPTLAKTLPPPGVENWIRSGLDFRAEDGWFTLLWWCYSAIRRSGVQGTTSPLHRGRLSRQVVLPCADPRRAQCKNDGMLLLSGLSRLDFSSSEQSASAGSGRLTQLLELAVIPSHTPHGRHGVAAPRLSSIVATEL